jgi:hypothetical protein
MEKCLKCRGLIIEQKVQTLQSYQAESQYLGKLLKEIPAENVIDRMSLESRKKEIDKWLDENKQKRIDP